MGQSQVLIVGAGPAGLALATCLQQLGIAFDWVDKCGLAGGAYLKMDPQQKLLSPSKYTLLPAMRCPFSKPYVSAADYRQALVDYAGQLNTAPRRATVESIRFDSNRFQVHFDGEALVARYLVVAIATGMFDHPAIPPQLVVPPHEQAGSSDGLPSVHSRDFRLAATSAQRILIVGGGLSGVETAEACARDGRAVTLSLRHPLRSYKQFWLGRDVQDYIHIVSGWLPRWTQGRWCDELFALPACDRGIREFLRLGTVQLAAEAFWVDRNTVHFKGGAKQEFDLIVCATGYRFATSFLGPEFARGKRGQPLADRGQSRSHPGLYFVGFPCSRSLISEFLRGISIDAPLIARQIAQQLMARGVRQKSIYLGLRCSK